LTNDHEQREYIAMNHKTLFSQMIGFGLVMMILAGCAAAKELTVTFEGNLCTYDGPKAIPAGENSVIMDVKDQSKESYAVFILTLDQGKTLDDLKALPADADHPSWSHIVGGSEEGRPGKRNTFKVTVEKEPIYLVCVAPAPPGLIVGVLGPVDVEK
jgi:hypothetical protein